jgi:D-arabinose 1-dehydrogenase-like Zn-dependent alcohol dehydrogenase
VTCSSAACATATYVCAHVNCPSKTSTHWHQQIHKVEDDWKDHVRYPMVPGHEAIGIVKAIGSAVTMVAVGQVVGFGPQRDSCSACEFCASDEQNLCPKFKGLYDPDFGGYATSVTVPETFAFPIPEGIPLHLAGPLLCAGITTFAPLARHAKAGQKVGVVGIGGLGHMGLQYARAMGCETVAITTSAAKEAEAKGFGAHAILLSTDAAAMKAHGGTFDFILCTASGKMDVGAYMALLKPRKSFCLVGLPPVAEPLAFVPFNVVGGEKQIIGSMIGGVKSMKEMLEFSAAHKCFPACEVIPFAEANAGFAKILAGAARYRMVLDIRGVREAKGE